jgi:hypothetical protein
MCKKNIPKYLSAIKKNSEKYNFSERVSPEPLEESRLCFQTVEISEKF